jgi:hypothetical protein
MPNLLVTILLAPSIQRIKDAPRSEPYTFPRKTPTGARVLPRGNRTDVACTRRYSITWRAIAGGSRPARSQPAAAAARGTPTIARAR